MIRGRRRRADAVLPAERVAPGIWRLPLRGVNAYAVEAEDGS